MAALVRSQWLYFSNAIRTQNALTVAPSRMIAVSDTRCALGYDGQFFECAIRIIYALPDGRSRSAIVKDDVQRDGEGQWGTAIVIREPFRRF